MQTKVLFYDDEELEAFDLNAVQDFAQSGMDTIVKELCFDEGRFARMPVTKTEAFKVTVGAGLLVRAGAIYPFTTPTPIALTGLQPSSGGRIVLIVATGSEANTAPDTRRFLIDADTEEIQPKPVSTRVARLCGVQAVAGVASASPSRPAIPAGGVVIASLLLGVSGIVGDPLAEEANRLLSLERLMSDIAVLRAVDAKYGAQIQSMSSTLAGLKGQMDKKASGSEVDWLTLNMVRVKDHLGMPDTAALAGWDYYATDEETDLAMTTAEVEGGRLTFGAIERNTKLITLLNPNDARLDKSASGVVIPKCADVLRLDVDDKDTDIAVSSYGVGTATLKSQKMTRSYYWYAERQPYEALEAKLKALTAVRVRDPITDAMVNLNLVGAPWKLVAKQFPGTPGELPYFRIDVDREVWSIGETTTTVVGSRLGQTFVAPQAGWYRKIGIGFTDVAATGAVTAVVCGVTDDGAPDLDATVAIASLAPAALKKWPAYSDFLFDPFFLARGQRYAVVLLTQGAHRVGISASNDLTNGTLFESTDGDYWSGQLAKDMCFRLWGTRFDVPRVTVEIGDITLPGGIRQLQAILTGHQPAGTDLIIEARIGGVWRVVGEKDATILATAPTQVPLRLTFVGTKDLMPALDLSASRMIAARPRSPSIHVSTLQTLPGGVTTNTIVVETDSLSFDPTIHGHAVSILHGPGSATETAYTSVTTRKFAPNTYKKIFTIAGLPNISTFKIKQVIASSDPARLWSVGERLRKAL